MRISRNSTKTEIILEENENSIKFMNLFVFGYFIGSLMCLYGIIVSVLKKDWLFIIITGMFLVFITKELFRALKITSSLKLILSKSRIKLIYFKFGKKIKEDNFDLSTVSDCLVHEIKNAPLRINGNSIILNLNKKKIIFGMNLDKKNAELLKKEIENWL